MAQQWGGDVMRVACAAHFTHHAVRSMAHGQGIDVGYIHTLLTDSLAVYAERAGICPAQVEQAMQALNDLGVAWSPRPPPAPR